MEHAATVPRGIETSSETIKIERSLFRAGAWGRVYLALYLPAYILSFFHFNRYWDMANLLTAIVLNGCYLSLLNGIRILAKEYPEERLAVHIKIVGALTIWIACMEMITAFYGIETLQTYTIAATLIVAASVAIGCVNIRIAIHLLPLGEEYGRYADTAGEWKRAGGWLMVTLILIPIGAMIAYVGDFYYMKMLRFRLEHGEELHAARILSRKNMAIESRLLQFVIDIDPMEVLTEPEREYRETIQDFLNKVNDQLDFAELIEELRKSFQKHFETKIDDNLVGDYYEIVREYMRLSREHYELTS